MIFNPDACENCKAHIQTDFGRIKLPKGGVVQNVGKKSKRVSGKPILTNEGLFVIFSVEQI